jgi:hypothetical protein
MKKDWKKHTDNRYFVYEGDTLKAAQSTKTGALKFMKPGRVIKTKIWKGMF